MENTTLNLSHEVSDIFNGKTYSFDPSFIIPLKQELFRQAMENDGKINPCIGEHFNIDKDKNELIFWYNVQNKSTKMAKIKIDN